MAAGRPVGLADCSLIIATFRRPAEVLALLEALDTLPDPPAEVIVVDGSPDSETELALAAWARERQLPFELLYIDSPSGLTRQRNIGIDASSGDFVFFLDDDCRPLPGFFATIRRTFIQDAQHAVGGVQGAFVNASASRRLRLRMRLGLVPGRVPGRFYGNATSAPCLVRAVAGCRPVDILAGGAMTFRREVLLRHRFSYFFDGYSQGEDVDMSLRVGRHYGLVWCGEAQCQHLRASGGRPRAFEMGKMEVRNRYFIWKRHVSHPTVPDRLRFWLDIAFGAAYDLASLLRTWPAKPLAHAAGLLVGALGCVTSPPRFGEPPAAREYAFVLRPLRCALEPAH